MQKTQKRQLNPVLRKIIAVVMLLCLSVVFGKVLIEAFSFMHSATGPTGAGIYEYILKGDKCSEEITLNECCENMCILWCGEKELSVARAGVEETESLACRCSCKA